MPINIVTQTDKICSVESNLKLLKWYIGALQNEIKNSNNDFFDGLNISKAELKKFGNLTWCNLSLNSPKSSNSTTHLIYEETAKGGLVLTYRTKEKINEEFEINEIHSILNEVK